MRHGTWYQVGGDANPGAHGAVIAKIDEDGDRLEIREIQPVSECVGYDEGREVGFPFWSRESSFWLDELDPANGDSNDMIAGALKQCGWCWDNEERAIVSASGDIVAKKRLGLGIELLLAEEILRYGGGEEGPCGWARDVVPEEGVVWWGTDQPVGHEHLLDEERDFCKETGVNPTGLKPDLYADSALGHQHQRERLAELVQDWSPEHHEMLMGEGPDDFSDEDEALAILDDLTGLRWVFTEWGGDLVAFVKCERCEEPVYDGEHVLDPDGLCPEGG